MLVNLDTAYADTTADDLSFALGMPEQPALRTLDLRLGDVRLVLRLLGTSHQVVLSTSGGELTETVACLPGADRGLPDRVAHALPGVPHYDFRAEVRRLEPVRFAAQVAGLRRAAADQRALAGEFPGSADAVTLLSAWALGGRVGWWTAHAYPQSGELVKTSTSVVIR